MNEHLVFELRKVTKIFSNSDVHTYALQNIDLKITGSDFISITGPSGCGKSTLLSILGLLDRPSSGQYLIDNKDVTLLTANQRAEIRNSKIGFIFQSFNLINELTVFENIALPLSYQNQKLSGDEIRSRVEHCLNIVDIYHRKDHTPNKLSGGQQQRVSIARALICRPKLLLVDEPTGNLDTKNGDAVMEVLTKLNNDGVAICLVTHDPRYADISKSKIFLDDGVIKNRAIASES